MPRACRGFHGERREGSHAAQPPLRAETARCAPGICLSRPAHANYGRPIHIGRRSNLRKKTSLTMATDYDAPRKSDDDSESIEALKERVPDKLSGSVDVEDSDNPGGFELPGADLSDLELDVVVLPAQQDEFTCVSCFLVKHRSQLAYSSPAGPVCTDCAA